MQAGELAKSELERERGEREKYLAAPFLACPVLSQDQQIAALIAAAQGIRHGPSVLGMTSRRMERPGVYLKLS